MIKVEDIVIKLQFIRNTLIEEFPMLSKEEINIILNLVYEVEFQKEIDLLNVLKEAREYCRLSTANNIIKSNSRSNIIKQDDSYAITFKNAFRELEDEEQEIILQTIFNKKEESNEYINACLKLISIINDTDEYIASVVKQKLLTKKRSR